MRRELRLQNPLLFACEAASVGSLWHLDLGPQDGSVVESGYEHVVDGGYQSHYFTVSTMETLTDFEHPVAGNRRWGIFADPDHPGEYCFYTMGVDRIWDDWFSIGDWLNHNLNGELTGFQKADQLWQSLQSKMANFVIDNGGHAEYYSDHSITARPYGITAASLDGITELADNFNELIGMARQTDSGNTVANTAINNTIELLRNNLRHFDLLIDEFEASNPGFVQGYHINSAIDRVGIRHSGIEGIVRNVNGEAIAHATVALGGTDKSAVTDLMGVYRLDRVTPDDYLVNVSATGYIPQQVVHHISRGRIDELDFHLAV